MTVSELITLTDLLAHRDVDDRLDRIERDGEYVSTTRNTVHAPSPMKTIGETLDELMCVPTDPPSMKIQVLAGKFWCRGCLWGWPGASSTEDIQIELGVPTFAYVGITMDRQLNTMDLFVEKTSGFMPFFHPDVFPVALIKIPEGATSIIEDYIIDLRPFLNFDISLPKDKIVLQMACLAPGESQMADLGRFRGGAPLISVYQQVPNAGVGTVHHLFNEQEKITRLAGANALAYYDPKYQGATLEPRVATEKIEMPNLSNVIFVSALRGTSAANGTKLFPFNNLVDAVARLNGMAATAGYNTIFLEEGIYNVGTELSINVPVTFIGESPMKSIIRMASGQARFGVANEDIEFRTIQFQYMQNFAESTYMMEAMKKIRIFNCLFKVENPNPSPQFLMTHDDRVLSNCVFYNRFTNATSMPPRIYTPKTSADTWNERIENNIAIGNWGQAFPIGPGYQNLVDLDVNGATIKLEDVRSFYPAAGSPCIDQGMITLVGADKDGTTTDIGLYGGMYASLARVKSYSIRDIAIFRYTPMTLFAPSLKKFLNVVPLIGFSQQMQNTRCAVSFDGGYTYVAWKETLGAWAVVNMDRFKEQANKPEDLAARLVQIGDIPTRGEIVIAWGIWTTDANYTPIIRGMDFTVQSDGNAIKPVWPETLDLLISSDSLLITNNGSDRLYNLTIVIY